MNKSSFSYNYTQNIKKNQRDRYCEFTAKKQHKNTDFLKLSLKALMKHFEHERQEMLNAGMKESDIFKIHFGELDNECNLIRPKNDNYAGDYIVWLSERRHHRTDHKYTYGKPLSLEEIDSDGVWVTSAKNGYEDKESEIYLESVMKSLTSLQKYYFIEVIFKGRTFREVGEELGKHHSTIAESVTSAKKKILTLYPDKSKSLRL